MNIDSYELTIGNAQIDEFAIELIYRGNECILIKTSCGKEIRVPRDILEKFMEMIR